jgi:2-oxoglutarate dehydrogenase E1 component
MAANEVQLAPSAGDSSLGPRDRIFSSFRRWGYLQAQLDPLEQYLAPVPLAELDGGDEFTQQARLCYCGTIGAEFMHIPDPQKREWIQMRLEEQALGTGRGQIPEAERLHILERLIQAEIFEQVIQSRYLGTKRFSLEGVTVLIPFLDEVLNRAAGHGAVQVVIGMSHRGRLNVMANTVGKSPADLFSKFEDVNPRSVLGGGDVKYHVGATGQFLAKNGASVRLHLVSNPSHLEAVDPVVMGRTRAKQARIGAEGPEKILPVLVHGDAAFAGQGIWAETLNFADVPGFSVGGAIHVIVNNLIGFTAGPSELHASRFASDLAKRLPIPIFHVNGEDPEAVVRVAALAVEYRYAFASDVVIDIIGYRRHGHSEVDDPTITQPLRYERIDAHPPLYEIYGARIGVDPSPRVKELQSELAVAQKQATKMTEIATLRELPQYWGRYHGGRYKPEYEVDTGLNAEQLFEISRGLTTYPTSFHIHPKIKKLLEQRAEMGRGLRPVDYGMAEALAFGSLVLAGTPVRLSGQDSQRGTFNQRHSVLVDTENESQYLPLKNLAEGQASFEVYNSTLSEAGVLGFEYGYSRDYPEALVLWEAQFGDFANGAQVIIDQFISSGEDKWGLLNGVVLLLPHGYEGQGPEHSSARIERYLQLSARDNMQVCQPSTAAQYFHLLRRQVLRPWRKPLVVFTPKSMLRRPEASSPLASFSVPRFLNVLPETEVKNVKRLLIASGKIGHELRVARSKQKNSTTGIVFLEQLYPWPATELAAEIERHPEAREIVWVQEEPGNMGAHSFVLPRLRRLLPDRTVLSVKRSAAASSATGSAKAHDLEQQTLISLALRES